MPWRIGEVMTMGRTWPRSSNMFLRFSQEQIHPQTGSQVGVHVHALVDMLECWFRCQALSRSGVDGEKIRSLGVGMGREAARWE